MICIVIKYRPAQDNRYALKGANRRIVKHNLYNRDTFIGNETPNPGFIVQTYGYAVGTVVNNENNFDVTNTTNHIYIGTICDIDTNVGNFSFNFWALDQTKWKEQPYFDWIEFDTMNSTNPRNNKYLKHKSVTLKKPFCIFFFPLC